ncbi:MAG: DUF1801 domain-containing protein [Dehalococcoidia bacterium]|jgi:hypothetical protein
MSNENELSTPKLLSGGNPQIPKGDGDSYVQAYISAMPSWKQRVGQIIDDLVTLILPDVRKSVRWNSPFYGIEDYGWFLSFHCFTKYVKVTFLNGSSLEPLPPGSSKHQHVRYLDIRQDDEIDLDQLQKWIQQGSKVRGEDLF